MPTPVVETTYDDSLPWWGRTLRLEDYELASVLAPARLVVAVGVSDGLSAHPGAFWDELFPRLGSAPTL